MCLVLGVCKGGILPVLLLVLPLSAALGPEWLLAAPLQPADVPGAQPAGHQGTQREDQPHTNAGHKEQSEPFGVICRQESQALITVQAAQAGSKPQQPFPGVLWNPNLLTLTAQPCQLCLSSCWAKSSVVMAL